ncbi:MAG: tRNA lysidine(34) synthetase TilS [Clostridia bacterium]|nr:tRNA lysidine(34) synthetase TilS [Clostridia bacterium]
MNIDLTAYKGMRVCVAVSGGRDSVALLHCLTDRAADYGITLCALNCDHKIRGEASAADSRFVKDLCASLNIPLLFFERSGGALKSELAARLWRLKCYKTASKPQNLHDEFDENCTLYGCDFWAGADAVATAHHADDNAETVIFNLARGSALAGLTGITDSRMDGFKIIHPMISVTRKEIDEYVKGSGLWFVDDESNFACDYTRNKIRHSVLPALEEAVHGAAGAIFRFSRLAAEDEEYFENLIKERGLIERTALGAKIKFCKERVVFRRAALAALQGWNDVKDYTSEHFERLYNLQFSENGKKFEFLRFVAFKEEGCVSICEKSLLCESENGRGFAEYKRLNSNIFRGQPVWVVTADELDFAENALKKSGISQIKTLKFDGDKVPDGAVIRFARAGDKFAKFGGGTKSLGDYFTDKKIPLRVRAKIPVLAVGSDIYCVCGVEISEKVKVCGKTKKILYLLAADYGKLK